MSDKSLQSLSEADVIDYITGTFDDIEAVSLDGTTFFFYDPDQMFPFATLVTNDLNDKASDLERPGIYRLNIGVSKATYESLLGPRPSRPGESGIIDTGDDFTVLDQLLPHPVYAQMSWLCILSPSAETFKSIQPLLAEAYNRDVSKYAKKKANG